VENVGRFLLTVRAEYLFLAILHYTHMEDYAGVKMEYVEFCRYSVIHIISTNAKFRMNIVEVPDIAHECTHFYSLIVYIWHQLRRYGLWLRISIKGIVLTTML
jgi:hypothetical protein